MIPLEGRCKIEVMKGKRFFRECQNNNCILQIIVCLVLIIFLCFIVWSCNEIWRQLFSIVLSAFLGAFVVTLTTKISIHEETMLKEIKDKSVRKYENKISIFSEFISRMFQMKKEIEDDVSDSDLLELRQLFFDKIILYLNDNDTKEIINNIKEIRDRRTKANRCFSKIASLLSRNLGEGCTGESLYELWNCFNSICEEESKYPTHTNLITYNNQFSFSSIHFWHFCMLGQEQIDYFEKHKDDNQQELSLIEYDEEWRTETLKRVKPGDIVFLFQRGGSGYIGVFKVIGTRVFDNRGEKTCEKINDRPQSVEQTQKDIQTYDIYNSIEDGASFCSNLIVTPLAFVSDGVSYPGGVYRKTISHYDETYAKYLLGRFLYMKGVPSDGLNIKCDEEQFCSLIKKFEIKAYRKDDNGIWEDNN